MARDLLSEPKQKSGWSSLARKKAGLKQVSSDRVGTNTTLSLLVAVARLVGSTVQAVQVLKVDGQEIDKTAVNRT